MGAKETLHWGNRTLGDDVSPTPKEPGKEAAWRMKTKGDKMSPDRTQRG